MENMLWIARLRPPHARADDLKSHMNTSEIISAIDAEIGKLQQARAILSTMPSSSMVKRGPGRPKAASTMPKKRVMTAEGKARIAEAQKRRWAAKATQN